MTENKKIRTLEELRTEAKSKAIAYNEALRKESMKDANSAHVALDKLVKEYAEKKQIEVFISIKDDENPMLKAITMYSYETMDWKDDRKTEKVTDTNGEEKEIISITRKIVDKDRQIDLLKLYDFCKRNGIKDVAHDDDWQYAVQKFNMLLCLRAARELGIDPKSVSDSYYMADLAYTVDLGKTPDSNSALLKALQKVIDAIIYEEGKNGNNYKATSHDVAYLLMIYGKKGKKALSVSTAKHDYMRRLVMDVCHRIVTGNTYSLEYTMIKK